MVTIRLTFCMKHVYDSCFGIFAKALLWGTLEHTSIRTLIWSPVKGTHVYQHLKSFHVGVNGGKESKFAWACAHEHSRK